MRPCGKSRAGFSLVELSVVLVIIGLLTGGILGGHHLVKMAELRGVLREAEGYQLALNNFVMRYDQYPGDFNDAERYWGTAHATPATCRSLDKSNMEGTCNGNGDGMIGGKTAALRPEHYLFWHHLQKAELLGGNPFTGTHDSNCGKADCLDAHVPGLNCPDSAKGSDIGWAVYFKDRSDGDENTPNWFIGDYGHILVFGAVNPGGQPNKAALTVAEVHSIDLKLDDGLPAQGKVVVRTGDYPQLGKCTETAPGSGVKTNSSHINAVYRLSQSEGVNCNMIIRNLLE